MTSVQVLAAALRGRLSRTRTGASEDQEIILKKGAVEKPKTTL
jgi:hypothetical protein